MSHSPQAKYRKDYQSPTHTITDIDLTFDLDDTKTKVTAISQVVQLKDSHTLILDGEQLKLLSIKIDDQPWHDFIESEGQLSLSNLPRWLFYLW